MLSNELQACLTTLAILAFANDGSGAEQYKQAIEVYLNNSTDIDRHAALISLRTAYLEMPSEDEVAAVIVKEIDDQISSLGPAVVRRLSNPGVLIPPKQSDERYRATRLNWTSTGWAVVNAKGAIVNVKNKLAIRLTEDEAHALASQRNAFKAKRNLTRLSLPHADQHP